MQNLIVHPTLGICKVIEEKEKDNMMTLVSITEEGSSSTFLKENVERIGIRDLISEKEAKNLIEMINHPDMESFRSEKMNTRDLNSLIDSKNIEEKAYAYSYLLYQKHVKGSTGAVNLKYLEQLEEILCEEISFVLQLDKKKLIVELAAPYRKYVV